MRIGICDDERTDLDCLMAALQEYAPAADAEIVPFTDAIGLLAHEKSFDLVFMDIEMPKRNGYDAATELVRKSPKPLVIFLTNSLAYTLLSGRSGVRITSGTPKTPPENPVKSRVSGVFSFLRKKRKIVKFTDFH